MSRSGSAEPDPLSVAAAAAASGIEAMGLNNIEDRIDFTSSDNFRNCQLDFSSCQMDFQDIEPKLYVNAQYLCQWSPAFRSTVLRLGHEIDDSDFSVDLSCIEDCATANTFLLKLPDIILLLDVIHAQRNVKSTLDLLPLMKASAALNVTELMKAICAVAVFKLKKANDVSPDFRRRFIPLLFKIIANYKGEFPDGMRSAIVAHLTRQDLECIVNDREYGRGKCSVIVWDALEHYIRANNVSQNRAMELLGRHWDVRIKSEFDSAPRNRDQGIVGDWVEKYGLTSELRLGQDKVLPINLNTLLATSSVFRTLSCWENDRDKRRFDLPDDSRDEWPNEIPLMLTPTVYGCFWRITPPEDEFLNYYLPSPDPETIVSLFRLCDKYNLIGPLVYFAEALMLNDSVSLMDKLLLADGCYRSHFLNLCFQDTRELARLITDPEYAQEWKAISVRTKERVMKCLAELVVHSPSGPPTPSIENRLFGGDWDNFRASERNSRIMGRLAHRRATEGSDAAANEAQQAPANRAFLQPYGVPGGRNRRSAPRMNDMGRLLLPPDAPAGAAGGASPQRMVLLGQAAAALVPGGPRALRPGQHAGGAFRFFPDPRLLAQEQQGAQAQPPVLLPREPGDGARPGLADDVSVEDDQWPLYDL